ncbi:hypothetical protein GQ600_21064 [Phytophthora cactorum]|nr:hypothetical protein GQ600_21064 [Phytophthora cactorum]KAG3145875.1 hypothetical protein C6341_g18234 [Phytophthora cactorum]
MKMFEAIQPNPSYNAQGFSFVDCWLHRWARLVFIPGFGIPGAASH